MNLRADPTAKELRMSIEEAGGLEQRETRRTLLQKADLGPVQTQAPEPACCPPPLPWFAPVCLAPGPQRLGRLALDIMPPGS